MTKLEELALRHLEQGYFVDSDGLLCTPLGRAAWSTVRVGRERYPSKTLATEMRRQLASRTL
jgi:hypothetical protein